MSYTSDWAERHGHKVHPELAQAIAQALPLMEEGHFALAIALAFDLGVAFSPPQRLARFNRGYCMICQKPGFHVHITKEI